MSTAAIIHWQGPYTFEEARLCRGIGLYFCWGRKPRQWQTTPEQVLRVGISWKDQRGIGGRIGDYKDWDFNPEKNDWWVGFVHAPAKSRTEKALLEAAEWMLISWLQPEFNEKKKDYFPKESTYVVNLWRKKSGDPRERPKGATKDVPDVIGWSQEDSRIYRAERLVQFAVE